MKLYKFQWVSVLGNNVVGFFVNNPDSPLGGFVTRFTIGAKPASAHAGPNADSMLFLSKLRPLSPVTRGIYRAVKVPDIGAIGASSHRANQAPGGVEPNENGPLSPSANSGDQFRGHHT